MQDKKKFKEMMVAISERYGSALGEMMLKTIWGKLKPYDDAACVEAFEYVFCHGRFWKDLVPDLIEYLERGRKAAEEAAAQAAEATATVQAGEVIAYLNKHGGAVGFESEDPVTMELMTHVWPYRSWAAKVLTKELSWWRKDFVEAYKSRQKMTAGNAAQIEMGKDKDAEVFKLFQAKAMSGKSKK